MMVIAFSFKKIKRLVEATIVKECVVAFHLHEYCRHNKSNAKTLGTGYKKPLYTLTSHVYSPCMNMCTGILLSFTLCNKPHILHISRKPGIIYRDADIK